MNNRFRRSVALLLALGCLWLTSRAQTENPPPPPPSAPPMGPTPPASADEARGQNTLEMIWRHGDNSAAGSAVRLQYRDAYLKASGPFLARFPNHPEVWLFRAAAALDCNRAAEGREAGQAALALGLDKSDAPGVQRLFSALRARGWIPAAAAAGGSQPPSVTPSAAPAVPPPLPPSPTSPSLSSPSPSSLPLPPVAVAPPVPGQRFEGAPDGIALQWIAPGTFKMGEPRSGPITTVHLTHGFWLGQYLVTQGQWESVMDGNPSHFQEQGKMAPIDNVSWLDCSLFLRRFQERERAAGRIPAGYEYRLPTEAEWEYACRAGTTANFGAKSETVDEVGWYEGNSEQHPHPVGQKKPNAWGLYDMHGNVWEWCGDWAGDYPGGEVTDPTGPSTGTNRINRGGCWQNDKYNLTSGRRHNGAPDYRHRTNGLRVALAPVISPAP